MTDDPGRWIALLPRDNVNFRWLLGEWTIDGHYGNEHAPSKPSIVLWRAHKGKDGVLDYSRAAERCTPHDKDFHEKLRAVFAGVEGIRLDA